jgi:lysozyme
MRNFSINAVTLLAELEGFSEMPYLDSSNTATIGFGTTKYPNGEIVSMSDNPITMAYAYSCMRYDMQNISNELNKLPIRLNQNQFDALICFIYNIGITKFLESTFYDNLKNYIYKGTELLQWVYITTKTGKKRKSSGLANRRQKEYELFIKK